MTATHVLVSLLGEIALLLWGIHMVSSGAQRALGGNLREFLAVGLRDRWRAFATGLAVTALLQSSTATALMVTSFTTGGAIDLVPALAAMLGANVGTTLIVQAVSFDVSLVYPLLILLGVAAHRRGHRSTIRDAGTALVGLGLMLLALHLLAGTLRTVETSGTVHAILRAGTRDPMLAILLAAALSWAAHSSVAAMLFIMSLAGAGVITAEATIAMVLGANLGSALNPLVDALGQDRSRLRVPVGNLVSRLVGCALALPLIPLLVSAVTALGGSPARLAADAHTAFNLAVALLFVGLLPWLARTLMQLFPEPVRGSQPGAPQYLDEAALGTPTVAVSNASREVLRMADVVEAMLRGSKEAFRQDDQDKVAEISRMDDVLDRLYGAIQRYLGAISREALNEDEARRVSEVLTLAINLEHVGDIIDKNLMDLASKRINSGIRLPPDALRDMEEMHARLLDHLQLAVAVFMFNDAQAARRLVAEKEQFRDIERAATQRHFTHMRAGRPVEIETSILQLDITRDLKRIEAHIAATAYGLLEQTGRLRATRLTP